jgi:hypothetical protein
LHAGVPSAYRRRTFRSQEFVMADSSGKQTGILGRLRDKRDTRRQRRAEKARVRGEAMRERERREPGRHDGSPRGNF